MASGDDHAKLELEGIWKSFGLLQALKGVDLAINGGEVHSLLGENGAGKSTLMNIVGGLLSPDGGEMRVDGGSYRPANPKQAMQRGIGVVHQEYRLVSRLSVAENLFLGWEGAPRVAGVSSLAEVARRSVEQYGFELDPFAKLRELSIGEQQRVAILRTLVRGADVLILDEPTATLTPQEADGLFEIMRSLASAGKAVIFITHKLREVMHVSHRVTVLRAGMRMRTMPVTDCDERSLAREMLGRDVDLPRRSFAKVPKQTDRALEVEELRVRTDRGLVAVDDFSFSLGRGEILGVAGVAGNGQSELSEALAGVRRCEAGRIRIAGTDLTGRNSVAFARAGVGFIPEDRLGMGVMPRETIARNAVMKSLHVDDERRKLTRGRWLRHGQVAECARALLEDGQVSTHDPRVLAGNLSGGNVQRLLIARELRAASTILVAVHPTRGLDVGATERSWRLLLEASRKGVAVVLISEDLDEILSLSDRILVMHSGRVAGEVDNSRAPASREELGLLMGGASNEGNLSKIFGGEAVVR